MTTVEQEVANGGNFDFYFNLDDVESIANSESVYYSDDDLFSISEQHACSNGCRHCFKKKGAQRNQDKMLAVLTEQARIAKRDYEWAKKRHHKLLQEAIQVMAGDLSVHIDGN
jgi:L-lysine 2,3-aminomutase